jgi:hypothetical protein
MMVSVPVPAGHSPGAAPDEDPELAAKMASRKVQNPSLSSTTSSALLTMMTAAETGVAVNVWLTNNVMKMNRITSGSLRLVRDSIIFSFQV